MSQSGLTPVDADAFDPHPVLWWIDYATDALLMSEHHEYGKALAAADGFGIRHERIDGQDCIVFGFRLGGGLVAMVLAVPRHLVTDWADPAGAVA